MFTTNGMFSCVFTSNGFQQVFMSVATDGSGPKPCVVPCRWVQWDRKRRRGRGRVLHSVWEAVVELGGRGQTEELLHVTVERLGTDGITESVRVVDCCLKVHAARDPGL